MSKLEKSVSASVKRYLERLEFDGCVLWWERLNSGKIRTEYGSWLQLCRPGTPDFIAVLKDRKVYFIETKSDSGRQTVQQKAFQASVSSWAIYEVVRDAKQVLITVELTTNFYKNKINEIDLDYS